MRKPDVPKRQDDEVDPANPWTHFREASWEEALDFAAAGLQRIRDRDGRDALAGFGSAKGSNEEAYLFQKLVRTGFGTNNVDHCTRLCHASSVAALMETIGSGAVTAPFSECANSDVIVVIGANPTVNHPVAATFMKNAAKRGATLIVMDPRGQALRRHATHLLQFRAGTDVALLNAMIQVIIAEKLYDRDYVERFTEDFDDFRRKTWACTPEAMAPICGIDPETIRNVARTYARAKAAIIFWGMGISQHVHGTDNARCLIALALLCGHVGKAGDRLAPAPRSEQRPGRLRRRPDPDGLSRLSSRSAARTARVFFEQFWGMPLDAKPGLTVVEIMKAILRGEIKGMYIIGENPAMSDPDLHHARQAIASLEHLVVQEIFLTETAFHADVILPATAFPEKTGTFTNTDRRVQLGRQALDPPGQARPDWWIIQEIARRLGLDWDYRPPARRLRRDATLHALDPRHHLGTPGTRGGRDLSLRRRVTSPATRSSSATASPPRPAGASSSPPRSCHPTRCPTTSIPMILTTGRLLEHWHTGAMTRRSACSTTWSPKPSCRSRPTTSNGSASDPATFVRVATRRGAIDARSPLRPRRPARTRLHPLLLRRGGGQPPDEPRARPVRQDPRVQVLRRQGRAGGRGPPRHGLERISFGRRGSQPRAAVPQDLWASRPRRAGSPLMREPL